MMPTDHRTTVDGIRWPDLLGELGKMESRIMAAVREAADAAHTTSDRLDGRLLEHGAQHARDRTEHAAEHQDQWDRHHREHAEARATYFEERRNQQTSSISTTTIRIALAALVLQFLSIFVAAVTFLLKTIH